MVAKITSGSSVFGVLRYNMEKVEAEKAEVLFTNKVCALDEQGQPHIGWMHDSFDTYLKENRRTEKSVFHVSLNPHPEDRLSDEQLQEIAKEYMEKMGYGNQPYIVFKHSDIDREHIHIVSVRVDENGKKINDSYEHRHSKQITDALEKKYALRPGTPKQEKEFAELKRVNYESGDIKKQIGNTLKGIMKDYHFLSFGEYRTLLSLYNIGCEEVKGEANGKTYSGLVYFALNDKGQKAGNPLKSSQWGKAVTEEAIRKRTEQSAIFLKEKDGIKEGMKRKITECMKTTSNREEFTKALLKKGIAPVFRENEDGRIYGVTFVDFRKGIVLNGSRFGKEFSANVFNDRFKDRQGKVHHPEEEQHHEHKSHQETGTTFAKNIGSLFDAFMNDNANHVNNEQMKNEKKKKKKKRRKIQ